MIVVIIFLFDKFHKIVKFRLKSICKAFHIKYGWLEKCVNNTFDEKKGHVILLSLI